MRVIHKTTGRRYFVTDLKDGRAYASATDGWVPSGQVINRSTVEELFDPAPPEERKRGEF
jgi:hypothetical protein